jgi:hypothetical protein
MIKAVTGSIHFRLGFALSTGAASELDICALESVATDKRGRLEEEFFIGAWSYRIDPPQLSLVESLRLTGCGKDRMPPATVRIKALDMGGEQFDRHMNEALVQKTDDQSGLSRHGGVRGIARKQVAEQSVFAVRAATPDLIARIEIAEDYRPAVGFEIRFDLLA